MKKEHIAIAADPNDPDDFDVTEEALAAAQAARKARVGRPRGSVRSDREQVSLRLPRSVLDHFKAGGPGWQTRVVAVLEREAASTTSQAPVTAKIFAQSHEALRRKIAGKTEN